MAQEVRCVELKRSESHGFGFSILGGSGSELPPIIYDIVDDSPASICGQLEAGDVILEVNDRQVIHLTTKEVLKCLRLAQDTVSLKLQRDDVIREKVRQYLDSPNTMASLSSAITQQDLAHVRDVVAMKSPSRRPPVLHSPPKPRVPVVHSPPRGRKMLPPPGEVNKVVGEERRRVEKNGGSPGVNGGSPGANGHERPRFETFTMTGDMILNLSRTPQYPPPVGSAPPPPKVQRSPDAVRQVREAVRVGGGEGGGGGSLPTSPRDAGGGEGGGFITRDDASQPPPAVAGFRGSRSEDRLQAGPVEPDANLDDAGGSFNTLLDTSEPNDASRPASEHKQASEPKRVGEGDVRGGKPANDARGARPEPNAKADLREQDAVGDAVPVERDGRVVWTVNAPPGSVPPAGFDFSQVNGRGDAQIGGRSGMRRDGAGADVESPTSPEAPFATSGGTSPDSEEGSDIESLHSFHFSPKAVDLPSAVRLAKRLYHLDGFKKSDVSRHLSKNNEFNRTVADEYLRHFDFTGDTLDVALGKFLDKFALTGETQERERVLVHFSKRYVQNNPKSFNSIDACHTLTCALMLLNTDLHVQHVPRKMTCAEFVDNLSELNDGEDFPRETLRSLYQAIKAHPLNYATDDEYEEMAAEPVTSVGGGSNPFLEVPDASKATEYKRGYVMRKCCVEPNGKRTALGKRSWRMFYCTLRDLVLYMHKDENHSRRPGAYDDLHNAVRVHHALATKAEDYFKKQHVFKLQTADQAEYLLQTSDAKELQAWIDTINFVAASLSTPQLPAAVGSQKRFQRPLLPAGITKLNLTDQLQEHERRLAQTQAELTELEAAAAAAAAGGKGARAQPGHAVRHKAAFLQMEVTRYRTYAQLLRSKMAQYPQLDPAQTQTAIGAVEEEATAAPLPAAAQASVAPPADRRPARPTDRYSYAQAVSDGAMTG